MQADTEADISSAIPNFNIYVGAINVDGVRSGSRGKQYSMFWAGQNLTTTELGNLKTNFEALMDYYEKGIIA